MRTARRHRDSPGPPGPLDKGRGAADHGRMPFRQVLLLAALALTLAGCAGPATLPEAGPGPRVVAVAAWGGRVLEPPARAQRVTHLTLHHQGLLWAADADVAAYLRRLQTWSQQARGWADLPYHYIVAPDGAVYAGRSPARAGETNTAYDPNGHVQVMLLGNFEIQHPTPQQWAATVGLLSRLLQEHRLPVSAFGVHRQHADQTVCPGAHLVARLDELRAALVLRQEAVRRAADNPATDLPLPE